ncbi:hypothetical protein EB796_024111 [Bugula neritina]|uniref:Meiosis regulator and mRNA stability factor 1 n=1 Tax=Bugula neritina TaxID=10212 RepID=A0A7J7IUI0_BUGNE|nr:hypothetical protein EB796_024111 [Bugula neritina]
MKTQKLLQDNCLRFIMYGAREQFNSRNTYSLSSQLSQFSREVVDLLKRMPGCQMAFSKFIPSYHHHFGRQCRVADFGFTKLLELFEAVPHVLQILGTGSQRVLYLAHRIHLRRFTSDLCRVLRTQPNKECALEQFPECYEKALGTDLNITNFGVCYIEDILKDVSESQVVVSHTGNGILMSIPKKGDQLFKCSIR